MHRRIETIPAIPAPFQNVIRFLTTANRTFGHIYPYLAAYPSHRRRDMGCSIVRGD